MKCLSHLQVFRYDIMTWNHWNLHDNIFKQLPQNVIRFFCSQLFPSCSLHSQKDWRNFLRNYVFGNVTSSLVHQSYNIFVIYHIYVPLNRIKKMATKSPTSAVFELFLKLKSGDKNTEEIMNVLLQNPMSYKVWDHTPMHWAARYGDVNVMERLLECETGIIPEKNPEDNNGRTPMHEAALNGHDEIIKLLMNCQSIENKNPADKDGRTPMHQAALEGQAKVIKLFLACETVKDKNPKSHIGSTPLHEAAFCGHMEVVKLLVNCDLINDKNPKNDKGETPMDLATETKLNCQGIETFLRTSCKH